MGSLLSQCKRRSSCAVPHEMTLGPFRFHKGGSLGDTSGFFSAAGGTVLQMLMRSQRSDLAHILCRSFTHAMVIDLRPVRLLGHLLDYQHTLNKELFLVPAPNAARRRRI